MSTFDAASFAPTVFERAAQRQLAGTPERLLSTPLSESRGQTPAVRPNHQNARPCATDQPFYRRNSFLKMQRQSSIW